MDAQTYEAEIRKLANKLHDLEPPADEHGEDIAHTQAMNALETLHKLAGKRKHREWDQAEATQVVEQDPWDDPRNEALEADERMREVRA